MIAVWVPPVGHPERLNVKIILAFSAQFVVVL